MVEQYVTTWLAKHSAAIEEAARRCPGGGWELQHARDETAKILGLWDEWLDFRQRVDQAHVRHESKYPAQWSKARKSRTDLSGGTLNRAAHESDDPELRSDFLKLHEEYEKFNRKFLGMFRSLLMSDLWYAMGSVDRDLADRKKVFPDAWDRLEIRSWYIDRISEPSAKGLAGVGHLHGVRIFPKAFEKSDRPQGPQKAQTTKKQAVDGIYKKLLKNLIPGEKLTPDMSGPKVAEVIIRILKTSDSGKNYTAKYVNDLISADWQVDKGEL